MIGFNAGTAYVRVRPDLRDVHKIIKRELADVDKTVDVKADTRKATADLTRVARQADRLDGKKAAINVTADTARANTSLASTALAAERLDGKNVTLDVKTRGASQATSFLGQTSLTMGQMIVGATALGSALIPVAAGVAAVGAALSAPLAAAGGGLTVFGIIAGVAVKRTKEQIKEIRKLQEAIGEAEGAKERAAAVQAYKQALDQLSPAQKRYMDAEARLSGAFDRLMTRLSSRAIFGPLVTGMNLLSRVLPKLAPLLGVVAGALTNVLRSIGRAVDGGAFNSFLDFFHRYAGPAIESFAAILRNVTVGVFGFVQAFAPLGTSLLGGLERLTAGFAEFGRTVGSSAGFRGFVDYVQRIGPQVVAFFREFIGAVVHLVQALAPIGGVVLAGLTRLFAAIRSIPVEALTAGVVALATGLVAYKLAMVGARVATAVYTAGTVGATGATWSLNAALRANPIGLVVTALTALVAGLVLAYQKSETFREIVQGAWQAIRRAASAAWDVIGPILGRLRDIIVNRVGPALMWWWKNVTVPAFRAVAAIIETWWKVFVRPIFRAVAWYIETVWAPVFRWIRDHIIVPIFNRIRSFIEKWWPKVRKVLNAFKNFINNEVAPAVEKLHEKTIKPTFNKMERHIGRFWRDGVKPTLSAFTWHHRNIVGPAVVWLYEKVIRPRFRLMGWIIGKWWDGVRAVFRAVLGFIRNQLAPGIRWLWEKGIRPTFRAIGQHIGNTWNQKIKPVFQAIGEFIGKRVVPAFRRGVDAIGNAWATIKRLATAPVNFVIDTVYNKGLRDFVNSVLEKFPGDAPKLPYVRPISTGPQRGGRSTGRRPGLQRFAEGGVLPGFTPGRDVHTFSSRTGGTLKLSGGESFMVPEWTASVGGPREVARMNAAAMRGRKAHGPLQRRAFARGGVNPVPGSGNQHSGYPWATWAGDFPVPLGTPVKAYQSGRVAFTKRMNTSYGNHIGLNHPGGVSTLYAHLSKILVRAGQAVNAAQVIGKSGSTGNSTGPHLHFEIQGGQFAPGGDSGGGGVLSWIGKLAAKAIGKLTGPIMGLLDKVPGADTPFGSIVTGAGKSAITSVADWVENKFGGDMAAGTGPIPKGPVVQIAKQLAAQRYGWTGRQWTALRELVMRESSWNPNAQNPTSSAYGLFQFLDSTWAGVGGRKTSDPGKQIVYGLRYIAQRYGNPLGALNFHDRNNWYDNGGWLNHNGIAVNRSRKPEPVFSNEQWQILKRAVTAVTMNQGRPINPRWLLELVSKTPKDAAQLRKEFLRLRDALRPVRIRTERARRALRRIRSSDRFQRRDEARDEAVKAFEATRSGEAIGEDIAESRGDVRRFLRRARRSPMAADALREYRKANRKLQRQRTLSEVEAAQRRTRWRRREAREDLERAKKNDNKVAAERARERIKDANRRMKTLDEEAKTIEKLTKQRDRAAGQADVVKDLANARKRLEQLREERKERGRLRREARRAGDFDILRREERAQERLNKRIEAEKKARDAAKKAAQAYRAAQQAALERARTLTTAGVELGSIGSASSKTSTGILSNLRRSVRTVTDWGQIVRALIGAGLRGPILAEFIDAGPSVDAVRTGKSLLAGGKIGEINTLQDQLRRASTRAAATASASYTPAQRAAIRRATPIKYQPTDAQNKMREIHTHVHGMPSDTTDMLISKTTDRVMYRLNREDV